MLPHDVAELLRARRPELSIQTLDFLGEGDFCRAYLVNGRDIVRVPRHEEAARALAREACLLPRIAPFLPVPVPRPTYLTGRAPADPGVSLHRRVPGIELTAEGWQALDEQTRVRLAHQVGGFLGALHGLAVSAATACGVETVDHGRQAQRLLDEMEGAAGSLLPAAPRSELMSVLHAYVAGGAAWTYRPAILHADVAPGHVLVDGERGEITGVIDWGDVRIGDPARDFIFLYEDWGSEFLSHALDGYLLEARHGLLPRIHVQYLMDQLAWTLAAGARGRLQDLEHGARALEQGIVDLRRGAP